MKRFALLFKNSFLELKKISTLTTTGILIAAYVLLEMFSIKIGPALKLNFGFLALAVIGMLFGPIVSCLSAIACDIIGIISTGGTVLPVFTLIAMLEGLIYGIFLYNAYPKKISKNEIFTKDNAFILIRLFISRFLVNMICNFLLNTYFLFYYKFIQAGSSIYTSARFIKNIALLPLEFLLMAIIMLPLSYYFKKATVSKKNIEKCKQ